jgi:peptidoglycan hydrolase-like protein with peptidoglycan-binding domain
MAKRPYTGWDKNSSSKRAGTETLIDLLEAHFGLWNNGSFIVRTKRGKSSPSVHGTGRAFDVSWRGAPYRGTGNYDDAVRMMDWLTEHADALEIEAIYDYYPKPWGRGYKCDRDAWKVYNTKAFSGSPGGDWVHIEISNRYADDPQFYIDYFKQHLGETEVKSVPTKKTPKKPAGKDPWLQVGSKGAKVKEVQAIVGVTVDGHYGPKTEAAVQKWQAEHDLHVDGIWGPSSEECYNLLTSSKADTPEPEPKQDAPAYPGVLRNGSRGKSVILVQEKVRVEPDGWYGRKTTQAVRKYQQNNKLYNDGVVGPNTWKSMFG